MAGAAFPPLVPALPFGKFLAESCGSLSGMQDAGRHALAPALAPEAGSIPGLAPRSPGTRPAGPSGLHSPLPLEQGQARSHLRGSVPPMLPKGAPPPREPPTESSLIPAVLRAALEAVTVRFR